MIPRHCFFADSAEKELYKLDIVSKIERDSAAGWMLSKEKRKEKVSWSYQLSQHQDG